MKPNLNIFAPLLNTFHKDQEKKEMDDSIGALSNKRTNGWGIASTTTNLGPFDSHTRTPAAKNGVQVPAETDPSVPAPAPTLRSTPLSHGSESGIRKRITTVPGEGNSYVGRLANRNEYMNLLADGNYFPHGANPDEQVAMDNHLRPTLQTIQATLIGPDVPNQQINIDDSTVGAQMVVVTQAIAIAMKGSPIPAQDAVRALNCLRNLDLRASIRNPDGADVQAAQTNPYAGVVAGQQTHHCPPVGVGTNPGQHASASYDEKDLANAWKIAHALEESSEGFAILKKLTANPASRPSENTDVTAHDDEMLHAYLRGAREKVKEHENSYPGATLTPDPRSLYAQVNKNLAHTWGMATMLDKGLDAVRSHLHNSDALVTAGQNANYMQLRKSGHPHEWALSLIDNHIYTDKTHDANGNLTRFGEVELHLKKLKQGLDIATGNDVRTTKKRMEKKAKQIFAPGVEANQSAFNAFNRLGEKPRSPSKTIGERAHAVGHFVHHPTLKAIKPETNTHGTGFRNAEENGIRHGRMVKEQILPNLMLGIKANGVAGGPFTLNAGAPQVHASGPGAPDTTTLRNLVRLAICTQFGTTKMMPRYTDGAPLDDDQIAAARQHVNRWLVDPNGGGASGVANLDLPHDAPGTVTTGDQLVDQLFREENQRLLPELFVAWARDVGAPAAGTADDITAPISAGTQAPPPPAANQPNWHAFRAAFDHVRHNNIARADDTRLNYIKPDFQSVCDAILETVADRLGARNPPATDQEIETAVLAGFKKAADIEGSGKSGGGKHAVKIAAAALGVTPTDEMVSETTLTAVAAAAAGNANANVAAIALAAVGPANAVNTDLIAVTEAVIQARLNGVVGQKVRAAVAAAGGDQNEQEAAAAVAAAGGGKNAVARAIRTANGTFCAKFTGLDADAQRLQAARQLGTTALRDAKEAGRLQGVATNLGSAIEHMELGSGFTAYSGGTFGAGLAGLSETVSGIFTGGFAAGKLLTRHEQPRSSVFSVSTTTSGNEMFLGKQRLDLHTEGVGGSGGWGHKLGKIFSVGARGGLDFPFHTDWLNQDGVVMRLHRRLGVGGDAANNVRMARVLEQIVNSGEGQRTRSGQPYTPIADPQDDASLLKRLLQETPDLSVGMVHTHDKTKRQAPAVTAWGGAKVLGFNFGFLKVGLTRESKQSKQTVVEDGGRMHTEKRIKGEALKWTISGTVANVAGVISIKEHLHPNESMMLDVLQNIPGFEVMHKSADFWRRGHTVKDTLIHKDGELQATSFRVNSHLTAVSYVEAVLPKINEWAIEKAKKFEPDLFHGPNGADHSDPKVQFQIQEARMAVVERERKKLLGHLEKSMREAEPTQVFQEYFELSPAVLAKAKRLQSVIRMSEKAGDEVKAAETREILKKLIKSDDSWVPTFLVDNESVTDSKQRKFDFVAKYGRVDGVATNNIRRFN